MARNENRKSGAVLFCLFLMAVFLSACPMALSGMESKQDTLQERLSGWFFYPILYYTPETRFAAGGMLQYIFRTAGSTMDSRPSTLIPVFIYTQNKQMISQVEFDRYWSGERNHLYTTIGYIDYPDRFYGMGNRTSVDDKESYTSRTPSVLFRFLRRLGRGLYAGVQYDFSSTKLMKIEEGGRLIEGIIPGSAGGIVSGTSLILNWDTRDNVFSSSRGGYYFFSAGYFGRKLGSDFDFQRATFDLRRYVPFFGSHVLAFQGYVKMTFGNPPFYMMSLFGGSNRMRGYFLGRYRDRHMAVFQAEYRMPVWKRIGVVGFAGIGDVAHEMGDFSIGRLKSSFGFGLRYQFDPVEKMNLRMDFGFAEGGYEIYIGAVEVF